MDTKLIYYGYHLLIIDSCQCRLIYFNQQYSILFIQNLELAQKGMKSQKQTQNRALELVRLTHMHVFGLSPGWEAQSKLQNGKEGRINDFLSDEIQWRIFVANSG
ncbi:Hypothetical_protein [Hexamita inflata]|uniref:Hypothetical_protein n=1 Tax=Hexamita inflata TaxID=28002 RepID=A0AA86P3H8_9EUKA|nr:Hypothetical protein HINF_LOCUS18245 [Hexamita inflata]